MRVVGRFHSDISICHSRKGVANNVNDSPVLYDYPSEVMPVSQGAEHQGPEPGTASENGMQQILM